MRNQLYILKKMVNFVDDGKAYYGDKNPEVVSQKLRDHYRILEEYMSWS